MTSISATSAAPSDTDSVQTTQAGTGHFMLTLCRLAAPVSIRPPQSPRLKSYTFFTSRARQLDGSEQLYLHMGYFETLDDAQKWLQIARERYPEAIATPAPTAVSAPAAAAPDSQPAASGLEISQSGACAAAPNDSLSDTQVMRVLDARRLPDRTEIDEENCEQIALLRPEDTSTRRALKEAVAQGAPVSFAVQLHWSPQPLDLQRVPPLPIFKEYTLYATQTRREGRSRYFLRLGFFADPVSAKQVAAQVRSNFASAAVVPVAEQEVMRAREACTHSSSIPCLTEERVEPGSDGTPPAATAESKLPQVQRRVSRVETLEQTLRRLAAREKWTDPDSLSESGVRHLKIEVQENRGGRPRATK
jgi:hypothetical protein